MSTIRKALAWGLAPMVREYAYKNDVGYCGWLSLPLIGVIAFRQHDGDLLWRW